MKVVYNKIIPFKGFAAINLFGVVFARKEYKPLGWRSINHEMIHTAQMKEMLYVFFYLWYVIEWLIKLFKYGKKAYYHISFECEAYNYQYDCDYLKYRRRFFWTRYL